MKALGVLIDEGPSSFFLEGNAHPSRQALDLGRHNLRRL